LTGQKTSKIRRDLEHLSTLSADADISETNGVIDKR